MNKKNVLITGASSGIGWELARIFARAGHNLIVTARNREKLETLKHNLEEQFPVRVYIIQIDLSKPDSPEKIYNQMKEEKIDIDILINNAGFGLYGSFSNTDIEKELQMLQVNISSLVYLTKLFLQRMKERNDGYIMNVASIAAFTPGPNMSVYYASKAFVLSFTEALYQELKNSKIKVSVLCPGVTDTRFAATAGINNTRFFSKSLVKSMTAIGVAEVAFKKLMDGKRRTIPGFLNKLYVLFLKFMPASLTLALLYKIQSQRY